MRKRIFFIGLFLWLMSSNLALAHPGGTDSSGGHTCRTNCEDWGLDYGEYHSHDSTSGSDYDDGYKRGYNLAYSYTSKCEEEYEWWWKGPQSFGDGYEQGIEDGHEEGLEVCYKNSRDAGYEQGYQDYIDEYEYNSEPDDTYDYDTYLEGYDEGWSVAESEDDSEVEEVSASISSDDSTTESEEEAYYDGEEISSIDRESAFDDGYDEGYEAAVEGYTYDDYEVGLNKNELVYYKKGYFSGYIEGGGGSLGQNVYYYLFQKYIWATILTSILVLIGLSWLISKRRAKKSETNAAGENDKTFSIRAIIPWLLGGFVIFSILGIYIYQSTYSSEPASSEENDNPYSYTSIDKDCSDFETQEDAQLFYEANGGPEEDPHDLDRDHDGIACDWNP
ncbi:YHYH domain-containing protein [Neobacillus sp. PS2-9]|uniref:YHYH domain-containing protein n=1 Tax=Neobacillus sp. PS2-9 TaxID=3070676 RepID=UPI0027DFA96A|nr:YHYH domain-containing protein [Neobacillus sp. PS2-9]WML56505.1 YHYH domain-containing protein [Neobacillus sp. PS2-9]